MSSEPQAAKAAEYFLPYQKRWLSDRALIKIVEKTRRCGLTYAQSFEDVDDIVMQREYIPGRRIEKVFFSSANEGAAREYIDNCAMWARMYDMAARDMGEVVLDKESDVKALGIEFANGGKIYGLTSNPDRFRGMGGKVVLDEFAFHTDQPTLFKAAYPSTTWGFPMRIISTHQGKGYYYGLLEDCKKKKRDWSFHTITIQSAAEEGLYDKIMGRKTTSDERAAWLKKLERDAGPTAWLEEFCCIAQDSESSYFPYQIIHSCKQDDILKPLNEIEGDLYWGWDISRKKDLSVFWGNERIGGRNLTRHIQVFEKTPFHEQENYARKLLKHPKTRRMCLDSTGMGIRTGEMLQTEFGEGIFECIEFNGKVKEVLVSTIKRLMEDRDFLIPDDNVVHEAFHSIQKLVTVAGNVRFDAERSEDTGHSDHFWAAALAIHASENAASGPLIIRSGGRRKSRDILSGFRLPY